MSDASFRPGNPYVGPYPLSEGDPLFGRERETQRLLDLLIAERVVLLYSPSGAGKTSLIQAALVPALREERFSVLPAMRVYRRLDPHREPAAAAANPYVLSALLDLEDHPPSGREQQSVTRLAGLDMATYLRERRRHVSEAPNGARTRNRSKEMRFARTDPEVLIFDQFEEILTLDPSDEGDFQRQRFFEQVAIAIGDRQRRDEENPPLWALFSIREDYLGQLEPYLHLIPTRLGTTFRLDLLAMPAALEAIQQPARQAGVEFTEEAARKLVDDLRQVRRQRPDDIVDVQLGPRVEPVQLQVVCRDLWEQDRAIPTRIAADDVAGTGDVDAALARFYQTSLTRIVDQSRIRERTLREWFDRDLITPQGIRGQVLRGNERSQGLDNQVIRELIDAHLVRAEESRGATWFELAHDRLIEPIKSNNRQWFETHLTTLQRQAAQWDREGRPDGLFLRGGELTKAEEWAQANQDELTLTERAFLEACIWERDEERREKQRNQRILRWFIATLVATSVALVALFISIRFYLDKTKQEKISTVRYLAARGRELAAGFERALLISLWASAIAEDENLVDAQPDALNSLLANLEFSPHLRTFLHGASDRVNSVAFSPDGRLVVAGDGDDGAPGHVLLWERKDGAWQARTSLSYSPNEPVYGVALSPKGGLLAAVGPEPFVKCWKIANTTPIAARLALPPGGGRSVTFSQDGRMLAVAVKNGTVVFDVHGWTKRLFLPGRIQRPAYSVAFHPQQEILATGYGDGTIELWDLERGSLRRRAWQAHEVGVRSVAFSPDGRYLASGSSDSTAAIWDLGPNLLRPAITGPPSKQPLTGHRDSVNRVVYSPDGATLISASEDGNLILWDAPRGARPEPPLEGHTAGVLAVAISPDGAQLVSGGLDKNVILWDLYPQPRLGVRSPPMDDSVDNVAFDLRGRLLAASTAHGRVDLRDAISLKLVPGVISVGDRRVVKAIAFSSAGNRLVVYHERENDEGGGRLNVRDVASSRWLLKDFPVSDGPSNGAAFDRDGKTLALATSNTLAVWDVGTRSRQEILRLPESGVNSLALSPDGQRLAAGDIQGLVYQWGRTPSGWQAGDQDASAVRHGGEVSGLAFSHAGKWMASASQEEVILRDAPTGSRLVTLLSVNRSPRRCVAFSPNDQWLAAGTEDGSVIWWDVRNRQPIGLTLHCHDGLVTRVAFSNDSRTLASSGEDGTIFLWDLSFQRWKSAACQIANRDLTPAEGELYGIREIESRRTICSDRDRSASMEARPR